MNLETLARRHFCRTATCVCMSITLSQSDLGLWNTGLGGHRQLLLKFFLPLWWPPISRSSWTSLFTRYDAYLAVPCLHPLWRWSTPCCCELCSWHWENPCISIMLDICNVVADSVLQRHFNIKQCIKTLCGHYLSVTKSFICIYLYIFIQELQWNTDQVMCLVFMLTPLSLLLSLFS